MTAQSYAISQGLTSLKQLATTTGLTQKRLKEIYRDDPKAFDYICKGAFHDLQTKLVLDSMLRHRQAIAV